jgi:hypothetical protein
MPRKSTILAISVVLVAATAWTVVPTPHHASAAPTAQPTQAPVGTDDPNDPVDHVKTVLGTGPQVPRPARTKPMSPAQARQTALRNATAENQHSYQDSAQFDPKPPGVGPSLAPEQLPDEPDPAFVKTCTSEPGASSVVGRVHNRFQYCRQRILEDTFYKIGDKELKVVGINRAKMTIIALGTDQSRQIRVYMRFEPGSVDYDKWKLYDYFFTAPDITVSSIADCTDELQFCTAGGAGVDKTWDQMDAGVWLHWDIFSHAEASPFRDSVLFHNWFVKVSSSGKGFASLQDFQTPLRQIRCDSATYFNDLSGPHPAACVFYDVIPHLVYSLTDRDVALVANHIKIAQDMPDDTYPLLVPPGVPPPRSKDIPGKFIDARDNRALHRISTSDPQYITNGQHKDAACYRRGPFVAEYQDLWLPTPPQTPDEQCDEYPFASTLEGAASPLWDFSVRAVPQRQNSIAGNRLGGYYIGDRILISTAAPDDEVGDDFWVDITADGGGGGVTVPAGQDQAPVVHAGGDVSGDEGGTVTLAGSASDRESAPAVSWSYQPVSDVDAGATCAFADPGSAATTISCTDDGVYRVSLTANDGVNAPVSDSALVTLSNVNPSSALFDSAALSAAGGPGRAGSTPLGPAPWSVYRVGTPVTLNARVTDPGTNDTETCTAVWDDGTQQSFPVNGNQCQRTHTYAHAGMYTITLTVTDDDGGSSSHQTMVVVYDPTAGTASGNGWIDNSGHQAGFTFLGSYPTATATVPQGSATFSDPVTGMHLRVDHGLEWVVITPDAKIAMKGTGELVPGQQVNFVLYAYRGCGAGPPPCLPGSNRYRIAIWPVSAGPVPGHTITYDNRPETDYDVDAANPQQLIGGTITILR